MSTQTELIAHAIRKDLSKGQLRKFLDKKITEKEAELEEQKKEMEA